VRYGGRFVFIARFLPVLRNMAAVLAGTNCMPQHNFYFASATAAIVWNVGYALAAYSFGDALANLASSVSVFLSLAAILMILAVPALISPDTSSFVQAFDNENAGTGKTLTPSGSINDGNLGGNYSVTFVPAHIGVINQAATTTTRRVRDESFHPSVHAQSTKIHAIWQSGSSSSRSVDQRFSL
jgi:hypothetical protein